MQKVDIVSVNHGCLVVRSMDTVEAFYVGVLGLQPWLAVNAISTLHLVHVPPVGSVEASPRFAIQHFALQVVDLRNVFAVLLLARQKPFQMHVRMTEHPLTETIEASLRRRSAMQPSTIRRRRRRASALTGAH
jgi:hypothetical protein